MQFSAVQYSLSKFSAVQFSALTPPPPSLVWKNQKTANPRSPPCQKKSEISLPPHPPWWLTSYVNGPLALLSLLLLSLLQLSLLLCFVTIGADFLGTIKMLWLKNSSSQCVKNVIETHENRKLCQIVTNTSNLFEFFLFLVHSSKIFADSQIFYVIMWMHVCSY